MPDEATLQDTEGKHRALFLMHNYNDVDHMTPVIDALMRTRNWQCSVIAYPLATHGSFNFESDWRFAYVRETHGVSVEQIENVAPESRALLRLYGFREVLQRWCDRTPFVGRIGGRDPRALLPWFWLWRAYDPLLAFVFTHLSRLGAQLLRRYRPDVIAVDWGISHGVIAPLLAAARKRGIRIIQLPHGAWTYEGIYSHPSQIRTGKLEKRSRLAIIRPDAMVIDNVYKGFRSLVQGVPKECLRLLGLARFTPQWQEVLASLPKGTAAQSLSGRPRLVWFTTWLMASNLETVRQTIDILEEFSGRIDIVLKVHTRNPAHEQADYGRYLKPGSSIRLVANEEESFAMTRWADLVLITQSSIVYDAFLLGKPVVYLKYTHNFECIWERDGVGDALLSPDQLRARLEALAADRYRPGYDQAALERFLRHCVCGGQSPAEVLPSYIALFEQAARRQPLTAGIDLDAATENWHGAGRALVRENFPAGFRTAA